MAYIKPYIVISLIVLAVFSKPDIAYSQKIATFQKSFGGPSDEIGCSVVPLPDKGFMISGITRSFGAGGSDILIIRTDSLGKKIWARTYGGSGNEGIPRPTTSSADVDMTLTPDSDVIVCSHTES